MIPCKGGFVRFIVAPSRCLPFDPECQGCALASRIWRERLLSYVLCILAALLARPAQGQVDETLLTACISDSIVVRLASVLEDGPQGLIGGGIGPIARTPDGGLLVRFFDGPPLVRRFGPSGNYLGDIGAEGEGPGEYMRPAAIVVDAPRGEVLVSDSRQGRLITFGLDGSFKGQVLLPVQPFVRGLWRVGADQYLLNAGAGSADWVGRNLFLMRQAEVEATYDTSHGPFRRDWAHAGQRRIAVLKAQDGVVDFVSAHLREFRIDRFTGSDVPTQSLRMDLSWFEPWTRYGLPDPDWVPPPYVADVHRLSDEAVIVVTNRPRESWRDGVEYSEDGSKRIVDGSKTYEGIIHLVDLERQCVRAEGRVPLEIDAALEDGTLAGLRLDAVGRPSIEFWAIDVYPIGEDP